MLRRLGIALALQVALLALVPGRKLVAGIAGQDVVLRTSPVDPYDLLSGWYTTLSYEAERPRAELLPAGLTEGERVYVVVERAEPAWEVVEVRRERPAAAPDRAAIAARVRWSGRLELEGLGRFYMPETERDAVGAALRRERETGLVDVRVGDDGVGLVRRLRLGPEVFGRPVL